jgi:hypothetical protein
MRRTLAVVAGMVAGVLLAGLLVPMLTALLPARLRGVGVLWTATAAVVVSIAVLCWWIFGRRRE